MFPARLRSFLTDAFYAVQDAILALTGRRDPVFPPRRLMVGGKRTTEEFRKNGQEFFTYMREICGLQPHERVLDVGCGIGQKMFPLLTYLTTEHGYDGFDIDPRRIKWLTDHVTSHYPHFRFQVSDIYNSQYNPRGKIKAVGYRFPYEDSLFDLVICTSVFTHMLAGDVKNYLSEISRVLRPGGRCLVSYFLVNDESRELMGKGKSSLDFRFELEKCFTTDRLVPEAAIAYDESIIHRLYRENGLSIRYPVRYGSWCGRGEFLSYQDLIIADRD